MRYMLKDFPASLMKATASGTRYPAIQSVLLSVLLDANGTVAVATETHVLAVRPVVPDESQSCEAEDAREVLPPIVIHPDTMLKTKDLTASLSVTAEHTIRHEIGTETKLRHLEGKFPSWRDVLPSEVPEGYVQFTIDPWYLLALAEALGVEKKSDTRAVTLFIHPEGKPRCIPVIAGYDGVGCIMPLSDAGKRAMYNERAKALKGEGEK